MVVDQEQLEDQLILEQQLFEEQQALLQATKASRVSNYILHLRQFSDFLLLIGYVIAFACVVAGSLPVVMGLGSTSLQLLSFLSSGIAATLAFVLLKFLSTLVEVLAEQQSTLLALREQVKDLTHLMQQNLD